MKKIIACLAVLLLCASLALPVVAASNEFTPSVSNKPAPEIVPGTNPDGDPVIGVFYDDEGQIVDYAEDGCLVITPVSEATTSTEIPDAEEALLLDVYAKLTSGEMKLPYDKVDASMNESNMVIRDLFSAVFVCDDHPVLLAPDGIVFSFDLDLGVGANEKVIIMTYNDGEWNPVEKVVNNGDGTVTLTVEHLCPIAISVPAENKPPVQTGDNSGADLTLWFAMAVVALVAVAALSVVYIKTNKKHN